MNPRIRCLFSAKACGTRMVVTPKLSQTSLQASKWPISLLRNFGLDSFCSMPGKRTVAESCTIELIMVVDVK